MGKGEKESFSKGKIHSVANALFIPPPPISQSHYAAVTKKTFARVVIQCKSEIATSEKEKLKGVATPLERDTFHRNILVSLWYAEPLMASVWYAELLMVFAHMLLVLMGQ